MAYGTETIRRVQKIVGPGGTYVTAAKLLVRNDCEIDFLAGPSEVLVIADDSADPELVSSEMLAQLEHDPLARAILLSPSKRILRESMKSLEASIPQAERSEIVKRSSSSGAIFILVRNIAEALEFSNDYAPEHLVLFVSSPRSALSLVRSAGSVFLGKYSSVAFGDYCAGTNHILPTKGVSSARSSLSTYDFLKIIPYQAITSAGAASLSPITVALATAEGLPAHARAASLRCRRKVR
jgi:histidinol dehydrogenase